MKLIDKSALVAEIERRLNHQVYLSVEREIREQLLNGLLLFIDNLEVKEVDFEKEIEEWIKYGPHTNYPWCTIPDAIKITAEHFFELGLKVKEK